VRKILDIASKMCVVRFSSLILLAIAVAPLAVSGDPTPESLV